METYTFEDVTGKFTLTVKKDFLNKCQEPPKYTINELNKDFNMLTYLHNETGPALICPKKPLSETMKELIDNGEYFYTENNNQRVEFWLDGHCINRENTKLAEEMFNKWKGSL